METFTEKYDRMMKSYAAGDFGRKVLSLAELLKVSGNELLFEEAMLEELVVKRDKATGNFAKMAWDKAIEEWKRRQENKDGETVKNIR